jgi:glutamate N-acetyltransferase/amino-acid N-acetyltransferase
MAKGAGMIGPRMATLLGIIMTDARLTPALAQQALVAAVDRSFNCISVEGHTSTNDTVLLIATGAAQDAELDAAALRQFQEGLDEVCIELARMIPDDGEGATHLITIDVRGCANRSDAHCIAQAVANSALVKAGVAGADPNWGRVVSAAGYAGVPFNPRELSLSINGTPVFQQGAPVAFDNRALSQCMRERRETHLELVLQSGSASVRFWTSDLTVDYVRFNSQYTT